MNILAGFGEFLMELTCNSGQVREQQRGGRRVKGNESQKNGTKLRLKKAPLKAGAEKAHGQTSTDQNIH